MTDEVAEVGWLDVKGRETSDRDPELTRLEQRAAIESQRGDG